MKKSSVKYVVGGSLVGFGLLLVIIAVCIGGWRLITEFNGITVDFNGVHYFYGDENENIIVNGGSEFMDNNGIKGLDINIDYGRLIVAVGDVDEIKIETKNIVDKRFSWQQRGDTLKVEYGGGFSFFTWKSDAEIIITLPKDMIFDKASIVNGAGSTEVRGITSASIDMENGAGELTFTDISASGRLYLETGAGSVKMKNISCGELELQGGVGETTTENVVCSKLEVDNGIGAFTFSGEINGNVDIDNGVGEVRMTVYGNASDYGFDVDSGIGNVRVNGGSPVYSSGGKYKFEIDTGVGEVRVDFKEKE